MHVPPWTALHFFTISAPSSPNTLFVNCALPYCGLRDGTEAVQSSRTCSACMPEAERLAAAWGLIFWDRP